MEYIIETKNLTKTFPNIVYTGVAIFVGVFMNRKKEI